MNRIRKITLTCLLLLCALQPLVARECTDAAHAFHFSAQEQADTTYTFRFYAGDDMFYLSGNDKELARMEACVEQLKEGILAGEIPVFVDGYSTSMGSEKENLAIAKIRSNRVKSELIIRQGLKEECFTTHNHATEGDFVTVRLTVPAKETSVTDAQAESRLAAEKAEVEKAEAERLEAEKRAGQERLAEEQRKAEEARLAAEKEAAERAEAERVAAEQAEAERAANYKYNISLRANLLRWVTLTPDVGIEWRICPSVGIAVNGTWSTWGRNYKEFRYALWEVVPEVRWYLGEKKAWYVGAMFKAGQFNYKFSETGRQGDLMGGGVSGGYQLKLNKALSLDFRLGLGYLNAECEDYVVIDDVRVRSGEGTKCWWGPIDAGVTLVWKLGK